MQVKKIDAKLDSHARDVDKWDGGGGGGGGGGWGVGGGGGGRGDPGGLRRTPISALKILCYKFSGWASHFFLPKSGRLRKGLKSSKKEGLKLGNLH